MNDRMPNNEIANSKIPDWLKNLSEPEQKAYTRLFSIMRELTENSDR